MFNPFYDYISPDQGYYTQQPATVDQVNNLWYFVQKLRRELSKTVQEFNKYPDRQEELDQNVKSITDQLELVQQQLDKLKGADQEAADALEKLSKDIKNTLEKQASDIQDRLKDVNVITPDGGSVLSVKKITGADDEYTKQISFTSTEDEAAINTNIMGDKDVINITQTAPGLLHENLAPRFTTENIEKGFAAKIDDEKILKLTAGTGDGELVTPYIRGGDGNYEFAVSSDGVKNEVNHIKESVRDIRSVALDRNVELTLDPVASPDIFGTFAILRSVDGTFERKIGIAFDCNTDFMEMNLHKKDDYFVLGYDVVDQFARSYTAHDVINTTIDGATISTSKIRYSYDQKLYKIKTSAAFDEKKLTFATESDEKHPCYFDIDQSGNVKINTKDFEDVFYSSHRNTLDTIGRLISRVEELEEKVSQLETRAVNQVTSSNIRVEPRQNDKLAIVLENYYANGKHEEKEAVINFTNQDGALVFHTRNQGISKQTEMFINMSNDWLDKQGLKSTTNA